MVEFVGIIEKIEYQEYSNIHADILLTIRITRPIRPLYPGPGATKEEIDEYHREVKETELKTKDFYGFKIGEVRLIQEDD